MKNVFNLITLSKITIEGNKVVSFFVRLRY